MEEHEAEGYALNTFGTKNIALAASSLGCKLIYISSDAVYDGEKETGYHEYDELNPINVYGKSKLMAELEIKALCKQFFIIRTALLFGYKGHRENNLIFNVIDKVKAGKEVYASTNQVCCPSFTDDIAEALLKISQTEYYGTYLVANTGVASRYEVNRGVAELAGLDTSLVRQMDENKIRPAKRARNTVFKSIAFPNTFGIEMPHWRDALERCMAEILKMEKENKR
jgi:dTDP-4-dehydrorhamnose reductase